MIPPMYWALIRGKRHEEEHQKDRVEGLRGDALPHLLNEDEYLPPNPPNSGQEEYRPPGGLEHKTDGQEEEVEGTEVVGNQEYLLVSCWVVPGELPHEPEPPHYGEAEQREDEDHGVLALDAVVRGYRLPVRLRELGYRLVEGVRLGGGSKELREVTPEVGVEAQEARDGYRGNDRKAVLLVGVVEAEPFAVEHYPS